MGSSCLHSVCTIFTRNAFPNSLCRIHVDWVDFCKNLLRQTIMGELTIAPLDDNYPSDVYFENLVSVVRWYLVSIVSFCSKKKAVENKECYSRSNGAHEEDFCEFLEKQFDFVSIVHRRYQPIRSLQLHQPYMREITDYFRFFLCFTGVVIIF